ncbi:MAG TPA: helix-turn-helix transcriptional regulator [Opitutaceae bacterium]|nr:helix-turn-helix transcriptional regulator [Opitutaceae bacterium]
MLQVEVEQRSLYPALYRLEHNGWIKAERGVSENNRKARFYEITAGFPLPLPSRLRRRRRRSRRTYLSGRSRVWRLV